MKISKDEHISGVIRVTSDKTGPHVVLFGGVHGDEVSGVHAVEKVLFDFFGERELSVEALSPLLAPMSTRSRRNAGT